MFILTKFSDLVEITPEDFQKPSFEAIEDNLNAKYANKVIQKVGLCICVYDILTASEGYIGHGTGIANVNVEFRLVVFRPFKGEVLVGKISSSTEHGIKIRLDFFDEIFVPGHLLFENTRFSAQEAVWIWQNEGVQLFFDKNETVRFRVENELWHDQVPLPPSERAEQSAAERRSPYTLEASMGQGGLGCTLWWDESEA
ncbi:MAG: DNA-directed RNA polymerase III subunit rpc25 [Vezdaea acicularis]|nr:MAG: DNA-directed RNA polymerase III subunit rpc25 [Vezdaea acicularis]